MATENVEMEIVGEDDAVVAEVLPQSVDEQIRQAEKQREVRAFQPYCDFDYHRRTTRERIAQKKAIILALRGCVSDWLTDEEIDKIPIDIGAIQEAIDVRIGIHADMIRTYTNPDGHAAVRKVFEHEIEGFRDVRATFAVREVLWVPIRRQFDHCKTCKRPAEEYRTVLMVEFEAEITRDEKGGINKCVRNGHVKFDGLLGITSPRTALIKEYRVVRAVASGDAYWNRKWGDLHSSSVIHRLLLAIGTPEDASLLLSRKAEFH